MIALSLAIVIVGLAAIGAAWHVATRLLDRRLVIAGEQKLREEMAALGRQTGELAATSAAFAAEAEESFKALTQHIIAAEQLAKKAEERARSIDVAQRVGGRS